jgi:hypothetical protein
LIRDGRRVPVFRPVPTDLGAGAMLASRLHHPDVLAISSAGSPSAVTFTATFMAR